MYTPHISTVLLPLETPGNFIVIILTFIPLIFQKLVFDCARLIFKILVLALRLASLS